MENLMTLNDVKEILNRLSEVGRFIGEFTVQEEKYAKVNTD